MNIEKDYYAALGVAKDADAATIKKSYRKLARELHPDKNPGNATAEARFKEVSEAYDVLSDKAKRAKYDEDRSLFGRGFRPGAGAGSGGGGRFDMSDLFGGAGAGSGGANIGDLFSDLFGGSGGGSDGAGGSGGFRGRGAGPARGQDVSAEVGLSFEQAVRGDTLPLRMSGPGTCPTCHGSGAKPGTGTHRCGACGGSGSISHNQGGFAFREPCRQCRGTGTIVDTPCADCGGGGVTDQSRTITVRVPAGVRDGARLRIAAKGTPGRNGAPNGDLLVTLHVGRHALFGRKGDDLTLTVPITYPEAALGTTLRVPTLDGAVSLKVAPGTPSGRTLRVRGRGVTRRKGRAGDLLVTVEVAVPQKLNNDERAALEGYAAARHADADPRARITAALRERDVSARAGHGPGAQQDTAAQHV